MKHTLCVSGMCHHLHVCHSIRTAFSLLIYTIAEHEHAVLPGANSAELQVNPE